MDQYEKMERAIYQYLAMDDVVDTEKIVSAYSLVNMLKEKMKPLHDVCTNTEEMEEKAFKAYRKNHKIGSLRFLGIKRKCIVTPGIGFNPFIRFSFYNLDIEPKEQQIICGGTSGDYTYSYYKQEKPLEKEIFAACSDEIVQTFAVLDEYKKFFDENADCWSDNVEFISEDCIFYGLIDYNCTDGSVSLYKFGIVGVSDGITKFDADKAHNIQNLLTTHQEKLLKKISLSVETFPKLFQAICKEKLEKQKELTQEK